MPRSRTFFTNNDKQKKNYKATMMVLTHQLDNNDRNHNNSNNEDMFDSGTGMDADTDVLVWDVDGGCETVVVMTTTTAKEGSDATTTSRLTQGPSSKNHAKTHSGPAHRAVRR
jgi:hypothetical protein